MKICWFDDHRLGLVDGAEVRDVSDALKALPPPRYPPRDIGDALIAHLPLVRREVERLAPSARARNIGDVRFLSPVANPSKIIGTPVNYLRHVEEADADRATFTTRYQGSIQEQGLFLKATSALVGCGEGVRTRFPERRTDHELELGVVIAKPASNVPEAEALDYVAGYAIALDIVVRGPEDRSLRKSIDTYAVLGPWLTTADEIPDPGRLTFSLSVNGQIRQASNTEHMILTVARQISWASQFYTLWPGDIIMTGTCEGVDRIRPGDIMHCEMERLGSMNVAVS
jgi:2-keto-4-pentenoate hydratase/2-oxohepta-3-ene-1,7-dioic acid hydratase in catechol pathway